MPLAAQRRSRQWERGDDQAPENAHLPSASSGNCLRKISGFVEMCALTSCARSEGEKSFLQKAVSKGFYKKPDKVPNRFFSIFLNRVLGRLSARGL
jgi:hypothetical protein